MIGTALIGAVAVIAGAVITVLPNLGGADEGNSPSPTASSSVVAPTSEAQTLSPSAASEDVSPTLEPTPAELLRQTAGISPNQFIDFETGQVYQYGVSTSLGQYDDLEILVFQSPGGLSLYGTAPDQNGLATTERFWVGVVQPTGRDACTSALARENLRGMIGSSELAGGVYVCVRTSGGMVAEFKIIDISGQPLVLMIEYVVWR
jgi:hypothetical protein